MAWSLAAATRKATAQQHEMAERSQALQWIADRAMRFDETLRGHIIENPQRSRIWSESPLHHLELHFRRPRQHSAQQTHGCICLETSQSIRKETSWDTSITLRHTIKPWTCAVKHKAFDGKDPITGFWRTSLAIVYHEGLCVSLALGILEFTVCRLEPIAHSLSSKCSEGIEKRRSLLPLVPHQQDVRKFLQRGSQTTLVTC